MSLKHGVVLTILLIGAVSMAGCTGSPQAPVTTPAPVPVAATMPAPPAPAGTAAPFVTSAAGTPEIPAPGQPSPQTFSFQGMADYNDLTFTTDSDATWVCDLMYPKEGVFTVILKNDRGEEITVLANEGGSGTARKSVWLKAGNYYFDVKADAPWYITMKTG